MARDVFRTDLSDLLGIDYPIVQSGMGGVAGPDMVAEVSRAGALGVLAGLNVPPDELRKMIRRVRELTDRPFGVNLWLHSALRPPIDPATLPGDLAPGLHWARFRGSVLGSDADVVTDSVAVYIRPSGWIRVPDAVTSRPDGSVLLASNRLSGTIVAIDTATNSCGTTSGRGTRPPSTSARAKASTSEAKSVPALPRNTSMPRSLRSVR